VLLTEFLGQSSAHDLAADARGSLEMSSAALAAGRANVWIVVGKKKSESELASANLGNKKWLSAMKDG
jgi:hypothetical protein